MKHYILVDREPVETADMKLWASGMEIDRRRVAWTKVAGDVEVSTVFLGIDHSFGRAAPLLFETMIFGREDGQDCWRYSTWDAAAAGHEQIVAALFSGTPLEDVDPASGAA